MMNRFKATWSGARFFVFLFAASMCFGMAPPVWAVTSGEGVAAYERNDFVAALGILGPLAEQGNPEAQFYLGLMYDLGQGVTQSDKESLRLYRSSADQGYPMAQYYLGLMYDNGQGVPQDFTEALRLYRLAGGQGSALAQYHLGFMYENGNGVDKNLQEAAKWYRLAATQGDANGQYALGLLYVDGRGTSEDQVLGYMWVAMAAAAGDTSAAATQRALESKLSSAQVMEAQNLSRKCKDSGYRACER
ncbi:MAG: sel1 repeat family protein [Rhodospirillaceae bacterium]|nr:sel1 repeat family protein [Rhodospirillaceae bacterium]